MKLILKLKDMCYYIYKDEIVWFKNKESYRERPLKSRLQSLKHRQLL